MFANIMYKEFPVCRIRVNFLSLAGIIIYNMSIIDREKMPFDLLPDQENESIGKRYLKQWLSERAIANSDPNLDEKMLRLYDLDPTCHGRMYNYQYLGAFLAYMVSADDDYWVNPTHIQHLSYALVDPNFCQLYEISPITFSEAKISGGKFSVCLRYPYIPN